MTIQAQFNTTLRLRNSASRMTQLLLHWRNGQQDALNKLLESAYGQLTRIGRHLMHSENRLLTKQTQGLIQEAHLRLRELKHLNWQDRNRFFSIWTGIMRRIMIDRARAIDSQQGYGKNHKITLRECMVIPASGWHGSADEIEIHALCKALEKLGAICEKQRQIVELRYFTGLSISEIAIALDTTTASVKRNWRMAQTWLFRELHPNSD